MRYFVYKVTKFFKIENENIKQTKCNYCHLEKDYLNEFFKNNLCKTLSNLHGKKFELEPVKD
jgi:hypothetical protein